MKYNRARKSSFKALLASTIVLAIISSPLVSYAADSVPSSPEDQTAVTAEETPAPEVVPVVPETEEPAVEEPEVAEPAEEPGASPDEPEGEPSDVKEPALEAEDTFVRAEGKVGAGNARGSRLVKKPVAQPQPGAVFVKDAFGNTGGGNDPHQGCIFFIEWDGFPANDVQNYRFLESGGGGAVIFGPSQITLDANGDGFAGPFTFTAAQLAGAPFNPIQGYHVRFESDSDPNFAGGTKSKEFWVPPACGVVPGTIEIDKTVAGIGADPDLDFAFTDDIPTGNVGSFSDNDGVQSFSVTPGTYNVTETLPLPANWALTGITCTDPTSNSSGNTGTGAASLNVAAGETVRCTWTNTFTAPATGTITVQKTVTGPGNHGGQQFAFTDDIPNQNVGNIKPNDGVVSFTVVPGTYTIDESAVPPNWSFNTLVCSDPTNDSSINGDAATAVVAANETVACTWDNEFKQPANTGTVRLVKDVVGAGADADLDFGFTHNLTVGGTSSFSENDGSQAFTVTAGQYTITEDALPANWALDTLGITCVDGAGAPVGAIDLVARSASITVAVNDDITCTWKNRYTAPAVPGTITIEKVVVGANADPNTDFAFTDTIPNANVGSISDNDGVQTFNVPAGSYNVTESIPPPNWALDANGLVCTDPTADSSTDQATRSATINVAGGETVACTFTNRYYQPQANTGTIRVEKVVTGTGADPAQEFPFSDDLPNVDVGDLSDNDGMQTFVVSAGSYTISEGTLPANWSFVGLVCTDATGTTTTDQATRAASIDLAVGDVVTCTWTNSFQAASTTGSIIVEKVVTGAGADPAQEFSFTDDIPVGDVGSLSDNDGPQSFTVPAGTYNVAESTPPADWDLEGLVCTDPTSNTVTNTTTGAAAIDVAAGETVSCVWTNRYMEPEPDLDVVKTASDDTVDVGDDVTFTITVSNVGSVPVDDVTMTDDLPSGLEFVSSNPGPPTCSHAGGTVTCNLGTLDPGDDVTITITATGVEAGDYTNTAVVGPAVDSDDADVTIEDAEVLGNRTESDPDDDEVLGARHERGPLPYTGSNAETWLSIAAWLLLVGAGLLVHSRRRVAASTRE